VAPDSLPEAAAHITSKTLSENRKNNYSGRIPKAWRRRGPGRRRTSPLNDCLSEFRPDKCSTQNKDRANKQHYSYQSKNRQRIFHSHALFY